MTGPLSAAMPPRMIDAHCHVFEHGFGAVADPELNAPGGELAAYEGLQERFRIARSLVIGYDEGRYAGNSEYIARLATDRPWLLPVRYVGATGDGSLPRAMTAYPADAGAAERLAARLLASGRDCGPCLVSLNVRPEALQPLIPAIRDLPETWFLISHLGLPGPVTGVDDANRVLAPLWGLAGRRNVSVKISGQYAATNEPYPHRDAAVIVDLLADRLGTAALVWGSDFSPCLAAGSVEQAVHCLLPTGASAAEQDAIYFANAQRMLDQFCEELLSA